jgi:hypothetical protein
MTSLAEAILLGQATSSFVVVNDYDHVVWYGALAEFK